MAGFGTAVFAQNFSVGASYAPAGSVNVHASWAFAHWQDGSGNYRLAARADASFLPGAGASPSFGLAAVLGVRQPDSPELYFGAGLGLAGASPPLSSPGLAGYGFGGVSFRLYESVHATVEFHVAVSRAATAHGVRLGLEYRFGAAQ